MGLEDYKDIVATSAAICTMGQMLSGTLICRDIYKKGSSEGFDPMPFAGGIGMGILMLRYALMLEDSTMLAVNIFGLTTSFLYMTVFCLFSPKVDEQLRLLFKVAAGVGMFLFYAQMESSENLEFRFGIIVTLLLFLLIAAPLAHLGEIIRTKNTEVLPFPLIFMGTIVTFHWLLYGIIINNIFIIFQNAVGFGLSVIQLSLFVIFPSKASKGKSLKEDKKD